MKISVLSDLHQEFLRDPSASQNPDTRFNLAEHVPADADVVVIAGDLDVTLSQSLARIATELPNREVVYVAGNHDFYNTGEGNPKTMDEILAEGRELAKNFGIHFLENDTAEIDGVRFIGATLWTDMESVGRGHQANKIAEARGRFGMSDYKRMKRWSSKHPGKRKPATPEQTIAMHHASREYIYRTLQKPFDGPSVVVTHHAPHPNSLDSSHGGRLDWCYASNLGLLFQDETAPELWLHGHIHAAREYDVGTTRIISNPRGYVWVDGHDNGFDPGKVVEIGTYEFKLGM